MEKEELTERPLVKETREDMEMDKRSYPKKAKKMASHHIKPEGLAPEEEIIQKGSSSYKSRYKGMLASEKEIVQEKSSDYKCDRY